MATTLSDIRFESEQILPQGALDDIKVIKWCTQAQADFMLRIFIPASTTLAIDTTTLSYALPANLKEIRRLRYQSDLDNNLNLPVTPVYTIYNGNFEVPYPFAKVDTLLIDYYRYMTTFTAMTDVIDLDDRFKPLYTSYIESQYFLTPEAINAMPGRTARYVPWLIASQQYTATYNMMKKQVASSYNLNIGVQKPKESGWGNK
jgi:hypothetical protein